MYELKKLCLLRVFIELWSRTLPSQVKSNGEAPLSLCKTSRWKLWRAAYCLEPSMFDVENACFIALFFLVLVPLRTVVGSDYKSAVRILRSDLVVQMSSHCVPP